MPSTTTPDLSVNARHHLLWTINGPEQTIRNHGDVTILQSAGPSHKPMVQLGSSTFCPVGWWLASDIFATEADAKAELVSRRQVARARQLERRALLERTAERSEAARTARLADKHGVMG